MTSGTGFPGGTGIPGGFPPGNPMLSYGIARTISILAAARASADPWFSALLPSCWEVTTRATIGAPTVSRTMLAIMSSTSEKPCSERSRASSQRGPGQPGRESRRPRSATVRIG